MRRPLRTPGAGDRCGVPSTCQARSPGPWRRRSQGTCRDASATTRRLRRQSPACRPSRSSRPTRTARPSVDPTRSPAWQSTRRSCKACCAATAGRWGWRRGRRNGYRPGRGSRSRRAGPRRRFSTRTPKSPVRPPGSSGRSRRTTPRSFPQASGPRPADVKVPADRLRRCCRAGTRCCNRRHPTSAATTAWTADRFARRPCRRRGSRPNNRPCRPARDTRSPGRPAGRTCGRRFETGPRRGPRRGPRPSGIPSSDRPDQRRRRPCRRPRRHRPTWAPKPARYNRWLHRQTDRARRANYFRKAKRRLSPGRARAPSTRIRP